MEKKKKKDLEMKVSELDSLPPLPGSQKEEKRLVQAEINMVLYEAVEKEMDRRDMNIRSTLEYSLKLFLAKSNPEVAKKLGIIK